MDLAVASTRVLRLPHRGVRPSIRAGTTTKFCSPRIIGSRVGSACRTSEKDHRRTTALKSFMRRRRSTTRCLATANPSACVKGSACCFACSMQARPRTSPGACRSSLHSRCARRKSRASRRSVDTLFLAPAERADVVVDMNRPGVWILGSVNEGDRKMGLGVVVEYANQRSAPQWLESPKPHGTTRFLAISAAGSRTGRTS